MTDEQTFTDEDKLAWKYQMRGAEAMRRFCHAALLEFQEAVFKGAIAPHNALKNATELVEKMNVDEIVIMGDKGN